MTDFVGSERGATIRQPSTANLMIDSADRDENNYPSPWNFQFLKKQSILNGFFTRIGTTEVVVEWKIPNITTENNAVDISHNGVRKTISVGQGYFTVADLFDGIAEAANTSFGLTGIFEAILFNGQAYFQTSDSSNFDIFPTTGDNLYAQLNFWVPTIGVPGYPIGNPDLRPYRYIDFVSAQLTYNQDLKDSATQEQSRDVLCRWYFDWDQPPQLDALGFPILMGYSPFCLRRIFNPPKQIKWDPRQPVGNIIFQVYGSDGNLVQMPTTVGNGSDYSQWLMTLQVSEN